MNLNKKQLSKLLNINDPFLMIDNVKNIIPLKSGTGIKIIKKNEWFFKCHLTNNPLMPGTLQTEAMLQSIISVINFKKEHSLFLVTKLKTNFYSKINKSGIMNIKVTILKENRGILEAKSIIYFNKKKTAEGIFNFVKPGVFKK